MPYKLYYPRNPPEINGCMRDGVEIGKGGWIWFLYDDFDEDEDDSYGFNNFFDMKTWIIGFLDGNMKAEMILSSLVSSLFYYG
jgi:hypothetical protein